MAGKMKKIIEKCRRRLPLYFVLGISPVGYVVLAIIFYSLGYCGGAIGSGVSCNKLPEWLSGYREYTINILAFWEISFIFMGAGIVWALIAFIIWIRIIIGIMCFTFYALNNVLYRVLLINSILQKFMRKHQIFYRDKIHNDNDK
ncbi:MAG: hypothetical protein AABY33_03545 [Pseudomonadota bacterium]